MKYAITDLNVIEMNITGTLLSDKLPWAWGHDLGPLASRKRRTRTRVSGGQDPRVYIMID